MKRVIFFLLMITFLPLHGSFEESESIEEEICSLCEQQMVCCRKMEIMHKEAQRLFCFDKLEYRWKMRKVKELQYQINRLEKKITQLKKKQQELEIE